MESGQESRSSHAGVTVESRRSHGRVTQESRSSHAGVTVESRRSHGRVTHESRWSHTGITDESRCPSEECQGACGSVDGVTMAIRSWETVGHSSLAQAEQKSRVTVGNYSLKIMNRSNITLHSSFWTHTSTTHTTVCRPQVSLKKKLHIPTLHSHFNSSLTLRLAFPLQLISLQLLFHRPQSPLPRSTHPFPLQPHLPIPLPITPPSQISHYTSDSNTPAPTHVPPLPDPNCSTPSRDPSPPVTPPASPCSCSAVAPHKRPTRGHGWP